MGPNTRVPRTGWLFNTMTLVRVIFPVLVTVPVNVSVPPAATGCGGQALVMASPGAVRMGQVELALLITVTLQRLVARTVEVLVELPLGGAG